MDFHGFGLITRPGLGRIWVGFGFVPVCKNFKEESVGTLGSPPRNPWEPRASHLHCSKQTIWLNPWTVSEASGLLHGAGGWQTGRSAGC